MVLMLGDGIANGSTKERHDTGFSKKEGRQGNVNVSTVGHACVRVCRGSRWGRRPVQRSRGEQGSELRW